MQGSTFWGLEILNLTELLSFRSQNFTMAPMGNLKKKLNVIIPVFNLILKLEVAMLSEH